MGEIYMGKPFILDDELKTLEDKHNIKIKRINERTLGKMTAIKVVTGLVIAGAMAITSTLLLHPYIGTGIPFANDNSVPQYNYMSKTYFKDEVVIDSEVTTLLNMLNDSKYKVTYYSPFTSVNNSVNKYTREEKEYLEYNLSEEKIDKIINKPKDVEPFLSSKPTNDTVEFTGKIDKENNNSFVAVKTPYKKGDYMGESPKKSSEILDQLFLWGLIAVSLLRSEKQYKKDKLNFESDKRKDIEAENKAYTKKRNKLTGTPNAQ
jgi:hypothetical protein